ncbi:Protein of unknown function (DUF1639 [Striga hermonthica]|uniref:Uncharacterized protein n=1 Tax=Striga hermonthica TaxID=68872 RepID=A0A9N7NUA8_STRHE|nr:Protein of unknown function (DUF1639 [Striga hermonthica]
MAAPPVKSQPLHNFPLSQLKWAHKKSSSVAAGSALHPHRSRRRDSPDDQGRRGRPDPDSDHEAQPEDPVQDPAADSPPKDKVLAPEAAVEGDEDEEAKPWNLRPRKEVARAVASSRKETFCAEKNDGKNSGGNCSGIKSQRLRGMAEGAHNGGGEREGKRKIWISLSKEEIEEDVYAFTGGRPSRRPRKWPRNVQKQLDNVFPGMYLVGVAADSYRVMMSWYASFILFLLFLLPFAILNLAEVFWPCML